MSLEREELVALRPPEDSRVARQQLAVLHQAALKADAVTGDAAWDTFASYIQRAIEVAQKNRQGLQGQLSSAQLVNPDQIAVIRNQLLLCDERIRTLQWVVTMPAEIKRVGSVAKERLDQMDAADEGEQTSDAA